MTGGPCADRVQVLRECIPLALTPPSKAQCLSAGLSSWAFRFSRNLRPRSTSPVASQPARVCRPQGPQCCVCFVHGSSGALFPQSSLAQSQGCTCQVAARSPLPPHRGRPFRTLIQWLSHRLSNPLFCSMAGGVWGALLLFLQTPRSSYRSGHVSFGSQHYDNKAICVVFQDDSLTLIRIKRMQEVAWVVRKACFL